MYGLPLISEIPSKPASGADVQAIMDAIRCIVHAAHVGSRKAQRNVGLSGAQLFVLEKLTDGKARSLNDLAQRTLTHQSSVSVVVQKLVRAGLVASAPSAADKRRVELSLTPRGRQMLRKSPGVPQDKLIEALHDMPRNKRRVLAQLLRQWVEVAGISQEFPTLFLEDESK